MNKSKSKESYARIEDAAEKANAKAKVEGRSVSVAPLDPTLLARPLGDA